MLKELNPADYLRAQAMFEPFEHSLSIQAVIEGNNRGHILVDDPAQPRIALALTMEGYLLSGDHRDAKIVEALRTFIQEGILTGKVYIGSDRAMTLAVHPASWELVLPQLIPTHEIEKLKRYHYLCRQLKFNWREGIPEGYTLRPLDRDLLTGAGSVSAHLAYWADYRQGWESMEDFLERGGGYCALHDDQIVSWCSAEYHAGEQVDVGVVTQRAHRQKGLATLVAAAAVEHLLGKGYKRVGWHCTDYNLGSWKTAERVGFERCGEYSYYYYVFDPIDHLVELGRHYSLLGEPERSIEYYQRAFSLIDDHPASTYHFAAISWAMIGRRDKAIAHLRAAADRGWSAHQYTRQQEAFSPLHSDAVWEMILEQMRANSQN